MSDPGDGADRDGPSDDAADDRPSGSDSTPDAGPDSAPDSSPAPAPSADADSDGDSGHPANGGSGHPANGGSDHPDDSPSGVVEWLRWFWTTDTGAAVYVRDVVTSVVAVLLVGLLLFGVSGIWPPMVAVESPSMEPNMNVGDLVFVVDNERFVPDAAVSHDGQTTGVVPAERAADVGHSEFGKPGDVIIYRPDGSDRRTPIIHRAMLFVEDGENWYDRADPDAIGSAESCAELHNCPAPHAGFITLGDNNARYDQQTTLSTPVKPSWIVGTAEFKVPYLGYVRLAFSGQVAVPPDLVSATAPNGSTSMPNASVATSTSASAPTSASASAA